MAGYPRHWTFDEIYDAQEQGCGDFIIALRGAIRVVDPGARLMVASRDAGAPVEIPAWCRLTGHTLVEAEPPYYLIRKRTT